MKQQSIEEILHSIPIFKELTVYEIDSLKTIAHTKRYQKYSHVFMQDDRLSNVYFILDGKIKIYKTDIHGREQIVNMLGTGDMFPHQGFFRHDTYPAHAEVVDPSLLVYIPKQQFEDFLMQFPQISVKLFRVLGDMIVDLQQRLEEQILHNTQEQIMMLILRLVKKHGKENKTGDVLLAKQFSNKELANMIGTTRETISRTISQLRKEALIEPTTNNMWKIDVEKIEDKLFEYE
ncbi:cyclic nucleotide-binding domain-containing protein [Gracilibacillus salitolerans]|uniref:Cyclic nucleotide-binding domain-containing protein n=1 Tax=Gracilibacillus salitolerans TaxID=2663022 RepID=A0A5Q2TKZ9_9BACI|nr:Crp/Fnr family transcriptional regulator [Gracilibacillus salitolerans]QGH35639.1 cyclic nucleotide-binding domain-containing protein [Gracilibacillus salitolerans]